MSTSRLLAGIDLVLAGYFGWTMIRDGLQFSSILLFLFYLGAAFLLFQRGDHSAVSRGGRLLDLALLFSPLLPIFFYILVLGLLAALLSSSRPL